MCFRRDGNDFPRLHGVSCKYSATGGESCSNQPFPTARLGQKPQTFLGMLTFTDGSYHKPLAYKSHSTLRYLVPRSWDPNRWTGHPPWSKLSRTASLAYPVPHLWLTRTHLLRWPYLLTILIPLMVPPCSSVSATLGNPWLSTPISSAPLNKSTVRTIARSWQFMRPLSTSDIWSKVVTLLFIRITSLSLMFSSNGEINARHDNSVIWSLLANSLPTSGMSQVKTMLWQTPYRERTPSRRLLISLLLRVSKIRMRSYKTFFKMVPRFDWNQCTFPGRTSISTATRLIHNRGHL